MSTTSAQLENHTAIISAISNRNLVQVLWPAAKYPGKLTARLCGVLDYGPWATNGEIRYHFCDVNSLTKPGHPLPLRADQITSVSVTDLLWDPAEYGYYVDSHDWHVERVW